MKCPRCGAPTQVLETRDGTLRRRECDNGHVFRTVETWVQNLPPRRKPDHKQPKATDENSNP